MLRMIYCCGFLWTPRAILYDLHHGVVGGPRAPKSLGEHPKRPRLEALVAAIESADERQPEVDEALVERLRALGYVE